MPKIDREHTTTSAKDVLIRFQEHPLKERDGNGDDTLILGGSDAEKDQIIDADNSTQTSCDFALVMTRVCYILRFGLMPLSMIQTLYRLVGLM